MISRQHQGGPGEVALGGGDKRGAAALQPQGHGAHGVAGPFNPCGMGKNKIPYGPRGA